MDEVVSCPMSILKYLSENKCFKQIAVFAKMPPEELSANIVRFFVGLESHTRIKSNYSTKIIKCIDNFSSYRLQHLCQTSENADFKVERRFNAGEEWINILCNLP